MQIIFFVQHCQMSGFAIFSLISLQIEYIWTVGQNKLCEKEPVSLRKFVRGFFFFFTLKGPVR